MYAELYVREVTTPVQPYVYVSVCVCVKTIKNHKHTDSFIARRTQTEMNVHISVTRSAFIPPELVSLNTKRWTDRRKRLKNILIRGFYFNANLYLL